MIICLFCKKNIREILIELCPNCQENPMGNLFLVG
jgi:hypothetical protein